MLIEMFYCYHSYCHHIYVTVKKLSKKALAKYLRSARDLSSNGML